jgi:hypothetical protein
LIEFRKPEPGAEQHVQRWESPPTPGSTSNAPKASPTLSAAHIREHLTYNRTARPTRFGSVLGSDGDDKRGQVGITSVRMGFRLARSLYAAFGQHEVSAGISWTKCELTGAPDTVYWAMYEQFASYDTFRDWLLTSYPEGISTTEKGKSFRDFVARLLPETPSGRRFGRLEPNPKHSHDFGVDVLSADPTTDQLALQSKFWISQKADIDGIVSQFKNYETRIRESPSDGQLFTDEGSAVSRPVYAIATAAKIRGVLAAYEKSKLASRDFYEQLKTEGRLEIWDGEDLRNEARRLNSWHFESPVELELSSVTDTWLSDGSVWVGIVKGEDLVRLEAEHGPGLFLENVRGWIGLEGGRDGETVNQAIRKTVAEEPAEMLARNNGVTFRASEVEFVANGTLRLRDASIINGRQTTGALSSAQPVASSCKVQVKVVKAVRDAWAIADAANNQNRVARIELRLARYFREQVVKREFASVATGTDWLATVVDEDRERQELFDLLRALLIGLFCNKPGQLADNNYSHIRWDVLDEYYDDGEPPPLLYPTLFEIARATNDAVDLASQLADVDPLAQIGEQGRPKYRAFLALLTLCATLNLDLSAPLDSTKAEVERVQHLTEESSDLLGADRSRFRNNFTLAYQMVALQAHGAADDEGDAVRVQQRLHHMVFGTAFTTHFKRTRQMITSEARRRELLG